MPKITREEVLKLATLSKIEINEDEIDSILKQLQDVLSYAERVKEISSDISIESNAQINIFANDEINKTDFKPIIDEAPESQDNFFVVPKIIENK